MIDSRNAYIGDKSWRKEATFSSSGASAVGYSLANLQNDELARVWRSATANLVDTQFTIEFPQRRVIKSVALCNINFSNPNAQVRFSFYSDTGLTNLVHQTAWLSVWEVIYTEDDPQGTWDSGNWWNKTLSETDTANRYIDKCFYFDSIETREIKVEISDEDNVANYVQIGICDPADGIYLEHGLQYGASYGIVSRSRVTTAMSGTDYVEAEVPDDLFTGAVVPLDESVANTQLYEFIRRCDKHTLFWWTLDREDRINELRHSYLARNAEIGLLAKARYGQDEYTLNFKRAL